MCFMELNMPWRPAAAPGHTLHLREGLTLQLPKIPACRKAPPAAAAKARAAAFLTIPKKSRTPPHRGALPFLCCPPRPCEQKSSKKNSHPYTSGVRCGMIPIDSGISGVTTARKAGGGTSAGSCRSARGIRGRNSCYQQCRFAGRFRCLFDRLSQAARRRGGCAGCADTP